MSPKHSRLNAMITPIDDISPSSDSSSTTTPTSIPSGSTLMAPLDRGKTAVAASMEKDTVLHKYLISPMDNDYIFPIAFTELQKVATQQVIVQHSSDIARFVANERNAQNDPVLISTMRNVLRVVRAIAIHPYLVLDYLWPSGPRLRDKSEMPLIAENSLKYKTVLEVLNGLVEINSSAKIGIVVQDGKAIEILEGYLIAKRFKPVVYKPPSDSDSNENQSDTELDENNGKNSNSNSNSNSNNSVNNTKNTANNINSNPSAKRSSRRIKDNGDNIAHTTPTNINTNTAGKRKRAYKTNSNNTSDASTQADNKAKIPILIIQSLEGGESYSGPPVDVLIAFDSSFDPLSPQVKALRGIETDSNKLKKQSSENIQYASIIRLVAAYSVEHVLINAAALAHGELSTRVLRAVMSAIAILHNISGTLPPQYASINPSLLISRLATWINDQIIPTPTLVNLNSSMQPPNRPLIKTQTSLIWPFAPLVNIADYGKANSPAVQSERDESHLSRRHKFPVFTIFPRENISDLAKRHAINSISMRDEREKLLTMAGFALKRASEEYDPFVPGNEDDIPLILSIPSTNSLSKYKSLSYSPSIDSTSPGNCSSTQDNNTPSSDNFSQFTSLHESKKRKLEYNENSFQNAMQDNGNISIDYLYKNYEHNVDKLSIDFVLNPDNSPDVVNAVTSAVKTMENLFYEKISSLELEIIGLKKQNKLAEVDLDSYRINLGKQMTRAESLTEELGKIQGEIGKNKNLVEAANRKVARAEAEKNHYKKENEELREQLKETKTLLSMPSIVGKESESKGDGHNTNDSRRFADISSTPRDNNEASNNSNTVSKINFKVIIQNLRDKVRSLNAEVEKQNERLTARNTENEYIREQYQKASSAAVESQAIIEALQKEKEVLARKANGEALKLQSAAMEEANKEKDVAIIKLESMIAMLEEQLRRMEQEIKEKPRSRYGVRSGSYDVNGNNNNNSNNNGNNNNNSSNGSGNGNSNGASRMRGMNSSPSRSRGASPLPTSSNKQNISKDALPQTHPLQHVLTHKQ